MPVKKNAVVFKGGKNGINIVLDSEVEFDELKNIFTQKFNDAQNFFDGAKTSVSFSGRELTKDEEAELLNIISSSKLSISFVGEAPRQVYDVSKTYYYNGGLRNGQAIRYEGSVVVIGDVNPGGEIIAGGNIIVLGSLKGIVHAGCTGNKSCYVAALSFEPIQLRIAEIITYIPKKEKGFTLRRPRIEVKPAYAYINDGRIFVEPLTN